MTSVAARQTLRQLRTTRFGRPVYFHRNVHCTPIAHKKKSQVIIDDLFASPDVEALINPIPVRDVATSTPPSSDSLFSPTPIPDASTSDLTKPTDVRIRRKKKLSPKARLLKFNQIYAFVAPRLGRKPAIKMPQVRKSAWIHLIGLATKEEQLDKVADLFPRWKDSGHEFDPPVAELFVRRCEELSCPLLALKIFGDFSKYNLRLSLPAARQLLHSLHVEHPIDKTITAAALYRVYDLPPIAHDLVSCSMLASACFKHNSKDSLRVANALTPHLQTLLQRTKPMKVSENSTEKALDKPRVWVKWSLKKVDKALLVRNGWQVDWLRLWRSRSGHLVEPQKV